MKKLKTYLIIAVIALAASSVTMTALNIFHWPKQSLLFAMGLLTLALILVSQLGVLRFKMAFFYCLVAAEIVLLKYILGSHVDVSAACFCLLLILPVAFPEKWRFIGLLLFLACFAIVKIPLLVALWRFGPGGGYFALITGLFDCLSIGFIFFQFGMQKPADTDKIRAYQNEVSALHQLLDEQQAANMAERRFFYLAYHEIRNAADSTWHIASATRDYFLREGIDIEADNIFDLAFSTDYLKALLDDLIEQSTFRHGLTLQPVFKAVEIRDVIFRITQILTYRTSSLHIQLIHDVTDQVPNDIVTDPAKLCSIVINLIANAMPVTPKGGAIELLVSASETTWSLSVNDSGPGIPEDKLAIMFDSQVRNDAPILARSGMGMGLKIVKEMVETLGGAIEVNTQAGLGTRFTVTFPLVPPPRS